MLHPAVILHDFKLHGGRLMLLIYSMSKSDNASYMFEKKYKSQWQGILYAY